VNGGVRSVTTALDVLDCFLGDVELGVSDVARQVGVAKSTAHRLLTSLAARDMVEQNPETGRYRLGVHVFELGLLAQHRMRLRAPAQPVLEELREVSGCSCHLTVPVGRTGDVLFIDRVESLGTIRAVGGIGSRWPAHATGSGKALAAFDPVLAADRRRAGFPALTPATIRSEQEFDAALAAVRRQGFATNLGEAKVGAASVAAAVLDARGRARAAVSLSGPQEVIAASAGRYSRLVTVAARRLSGLMAA
jgi:DNA-binding IclR family transcriptional regulator